MTAGSRILFVSSLVLVAAPSLGQPPGGGGLPVGIAEALAREVRQTVELTGTVESRSSSVVASSVSGIVVELSAREGDVVGKGQPLAKLRPDDLTRRVASARGDLDEARALLRLAEMRRDRAQELFDDEVISQAQLDDALSEFDASVGRTTRLEADLGRYEDELRRSVIRAPFGGVVVEELTAVGEWVSPGSPVARFVDPRNLELAIEVPEQYFGGLAAGNEVEVRVAALGLATAGTIRAVVPQADARSRTFPVKVALPNPEGKIGVGMLAAVSLPVGELKAAVLVPKDAIVRRGPTNVVYRLSLDSLAELVEVRTGPALGNWIAVVGELSAGDQVIVQGNERLQPGQPVSGKELVLELP